MDVSKAPRALKNDRLRSQRASAIRLPHVRPINDLIDEIGRDVGVENLAYNDPTFGGLDAEVLFVLKALEGDASSDSKRVNFRASTTTTPVLSSCSVLATGWASLATNARGGISVRSRPRGRTLREPNWNVRVRIRCEFSNSYRSSQWFFCLAIQLRRGGSPGFCVVVLTSRSFWAHPHPHLVSIRSATAKISKAPFAAQ
ncbi:hypothetical protein DFR67_103452 [Williamsia limnetica]|uniref:Uncharacterized protein n=1 Tax=Williamsia limnetica TaxID=882452 RepID=A0A318S5X9_WILLI|nr:hypothetical protein [Williamsia limnetica]PYE19539.1 hypothetical protein DFR67_103452 [Williamsia limnetica]